MTRLVFCPKFVFEELLKIPFNKIQINHIQKLTGKSERTIYFWFEQERIPKRTDFLMLMDLYAQNLNGECLGVASPINGRELIRSLKNPDWNSFALTELRANEDLFPRTLRTLRQNLHANFVNCAAPPDPYRIGNCLPREILKNAYSKYDEDSVCYSKVVLEDLLEVMGVLFYLAFLELEYFETIEREEPYLMTKLPSYVEPGTRSVNTPVELFLGGFFEKLVAKGIYANKHEIEIKIEKDLLRPGSLDEAGRLVRRFVRDAKIPSWFTFNQWITSLCPREFEGKAIDQEDMLFYAQNLFGATSALDRTFRIYERGFGRIKGVDPVGEFSGLYEAFYMNLRAQFKWGGSSDPPPKS